MSGWEWGGGSGGGEGQSSHAGSQPGGGVEPQGEVSPDAVRAMAEQWSLAADSTLLKLLENIHKTVVVKCEVATARIEEMSTALDTASVSLQNVTNRFNALSNSQFIESRVYDEDVAPSDTAHDTGTQPGRTRAEPAAAAAALGATLAEYYDELRIAPGDSDSDASDCEDSVVLRPRELYAHRPLPHVIGSRGWTNKWHAGLVDEESDSGSSADGREALGEREREDEEQFSSSDECSAEPREARAPPLRRREEARSGDSGGSVGSASCDMAPLAPQPPPPPPDAPRVKPSPSDFAAELARRLGGGDAAPAAPAAATAPAATPAAPAARPPRAAPRTGSIFSDEPPPIEDSIDDEVTDEQNDDDDDIFADLHDTTIFSKSASIFSKNTKAGQQSYGGLFDDLLPTEINKNKRETPKDIFDDFSDDNPNVFKKENERKDKPTEIYSKNIDNSTKTQDLSAKNSVLRSSGLFDDDEDDLFADVGIGSSNPVAGKTTNPKPTSSKIKGLFDDDDEEDIFTDTVITANIKDGEKSQYVKETKVNENPTNSAIETKPSNAPNAFKVEPDNSAKIAKTERKAQDVEVVTNIPVSVNEVTSFKTPIGGVSLFGTKQDSNSIGEAILKHSRRKYSSSSEDNNSEPRHQSKHSDSKHITDNSNDDNIDDLFSVGQTAKEMTKEPIKKSSANDKFGDLFAESSSKEKKPTSQIDNSKLNDDLFEDEDIFISSSKAKADKKLDVIKSLFDDDEEDGLFSNINRTVTKSNNSSKTVTKEMNSDSSSLFNDDKEKNLFAEPLVNKHAAVPKMKQMVSCKKATIIIPDNGCEAVDKDNRENRIDDIQNVTPLHSDENNRVFDENKDTQNVPVFKEIPIVNKSLTLNSIDVITSDTNEFYAPVLQNTITNVCEEAISNPQPPSNDIPDQAREMIINKDNKDNVSQIDRPDRPGDDFFDTIFDDQPPVFQKKSEPKKSKNINALFDDDSDDDGLFLKKQDSFSVTNSDDSKSLDDFLPSTDDKLCHIFHNEPPDLSMGDTAPNDKTIGTIEKSEGRKSNVHVISNDKKIVLLAKQSSETTSEEPEELEKPLFEAPQEGTSQNIFEDLEYVRTVRSEDGQKHQEIISPTKSKIESLPNQIKHISSQDKIHHETQVTNLKRSEIKNKYDLVKHRASGEASKDTQSGDRLKPVGKLRPMNLNINVHGLLPGAIPKKINNKELTTAIENTINSETCKVDNIDSTDSSLTKSVSFEKVPQSPTLVNTFSKERARIQVKRRPSSRKARKDAIRKSAVDIDCDSDVSGGVDLPDNFTVSLPNSPQEEGKPLESKLENDVEAKCNESDNSNQSEDCRVYTSVQSNSNSSTAQISTLGKVYAKKINIDSKQSVKTSACENTYESDKSIVSGSDDIFKYETFRSLDKSLPHITETLKEKPKVSGENQSVEKEENICSDKSLTVKENDGTKEFAEKKMFDSDDSEFDELFKSSAVQNEPILKQLPTVHKMNIQYKLPGEQNMLPKNNKVSVESEINTPAKVFQEKPPIIKKSLFLDEDIDDDDLFGGGVTTEVLHKLRETKIDNIHGAEKLQTDDEDLFFSNKKDDFMKKSAFSKPFLERKSLFGDDDSNGEIFGQKSKTMEEPSKSAVAKIKEETSQTAGTSAEEVFNDPLSFFD